MITFLRTRLQIALKACKLAFDLIDAATASDEQHAAIAALEAAVSARAELQLAACALEPFSIDTNRDNELSRMRVTLESIEKLLARRQA